MGFDTPISCCRPATWRISTLGLSAESALTLSLKRLHRPAENAASATVISTNNQRELGMDNLLPIVEYFVSIT
jgi:hypothetical protein